MKHDVWRTASIGDAVEPVARPERVVPDQTYRLLGVRWYGRGCHLHTTAAGAALKTPQLNRVASGDVTYNKMWVTKGAFAVVGPDCDGLTATSEYPLFTVRRDSAAPEFIQWAMNTDAFVRAAADASRGSTSRRRLNPSDFLRLPLPLPPLAEQRKIAAILSAVDGAIEATQAVIDQLQIVKKAMMAELLARGVPGGHTQYEQTPIGVFPKDWSLCSIDELGVPGEPTVRSGPFGSSMKTKDFQSHGVKVLTIQSLGEGRILPDGLFFVDHVKAEELSEYRVRENDVVFSRVADIGRCAAISPHEAGWLISPNLSRIRLDPRKVDAAFFMYLITLGAAVSRQVQAVTGNAGRPVISSTTLKAIQLPVPPISEQRAIAHAGYEAEYRILCEKECVQGLRDMKAALMTALLSGEVRVTSDKAV